MSASTARPAAAAQPRRPLSPKARRTLKRTFLALAILLLAWGVWKYWLKPWLFPPSPLVRTPIIGLQQLQAKSLYYNGDARAVLLAYRPDLLPDDDRGAEGPRVRGYSQATLEPRLFERLDERNHFDTVLLLGDRSHFQKLLDHLITPEPSRRDFKLVYLDHWMFVFKRGASREWEIADAEPLKAKMQNLRKEDRAAFLAKTAERILALGLKAQAKQWFDEALALDSSSVEALTGMADFYAIEGLWAEADAFADKALEEQADYAPALQKKFVALLGRKYVSDAFKVSEKLLKKSGENPSLLLQHSRVAHLAEKYDAEIETLQRLIALAEKDKRIIGEYEFSLGEAHAVAAQKDRAHMPKAEEHFRKSLADPALPIKMRETALDRLRAIAIEKAREAKSPK
jgi:tetratricopeptide (TPR) repeat protein